jgi:hypothetical protein
MTPDDSQVPTERDFLDPRSQDPDERNALRNFLGKTSEQAAEMFRERFILYQEDLLWMGPNAFRYYLPPALEYVCSPAADGDSDGVNMLYGILHLRRKEIAADPVLAPTVADAIRSIVSDFGRFRCKADIYGDLESRYRRVLVGLRPGG